MLIIAKFVASAAVGAPSQRKAVINAACADAGSVAPDSGALDIKPERCNNASTLANLIKSEPLTRTGYIPVQSRCGKHKNTTNQIKLGGDSYTRDRCFSDHQNIEREEGYKKVVLDTRQRREGLPFSHLLKFCPGSPTRHIGHESLSSLLQVILDLSS